MHLAVVIPAYNEAGVIEQVIASLPKKLTGVKAITPIIVDDNSSDNTYQLAKKAGVICIRHEANLGAGGATLTGFEAAKKLKADLIVTMDGDGQHSPDDLDALIKPILAGTHDVVLGSRLLRLTGEMPWHKKVGNNVLNAVTYVFFRIWVTDSQSGYKAFSRRALSKITISTSGYEFCSEIVGEIKRRNLRYCEVPISTIYTDYSKAKGQLALNAVNIVLGLLLRGVR